ncbi:hypothetical protein FDP41_007635 [Naegleria fowleri]|uniref:N-acetyltransferase domain-containing protein n=1 Tax=Naegleria fowleri TaxID=5763 RepID=A0A6A5CDR7_NAEFO|nr:uncharacterized protein FDP41_007635 [Naegleria fowleri]KAF0983720.1 hypothetical protein FDP41_007635 [Naegleria fowleri]CAG4716835.1 unnamed protein product [Naegleria fowleri]
MSVVNTTTSLDSIITIHPLDSTRVNDMVSINSIVLPVSYHSKVYDQMVSDRLSFIAYLKTESNGSSGEKEIPVGAIGCILKTDVHASPDHVGLCIASLAVLAKYRSKGIGAKLLERVMQALDEWLKASSSSLEISSNHHEEPLQEESLNSTSSSSEFIVYLQTQTNNRDAIKFYERHGFQVLKKVENFYKRLTPPDCFVLVLKRKIESIQNQILK